MVLDELLKGGFGGGELVSLGLDAGAVLRILIDFEPAAGFVGSDDLFGGLVLRLRLYALLETAFDVLDILHFGLLAEGGQLLERVPLRLFLHNKQ